MANVNSIMRKAQTTTTTTTASEIESAFVIANDSKNHCDYELANAIFAWLLDLHQNSNPHCKFKIGLEYLPEDEDGYGEGCPLSNPASWITTENVHSEQYHLLVFLYTGTKENPHNYMCVPAPMLSTKALRYCFGQAKRGGSMPRREHERCYADSGEPIASIKNIEKHLKSFKFAAWVFDAYQASRIQASIDSTAE